MAQPVKRRETKEQRSRIMKAVRSIDTAPEMIVRSLAHGMGFRFRLHRRDLPGKPDVVFPRFRKVIFVHGCFWHGHDCTRGARLPKNNSKYWQEKLRDNSLRDVAHQIALKKIGWKSAVIWECELKEPNRVKQRIVRFLAK